MTTQPRRREIVFHSVASAVVLWSIAAVFAGASASPAGAQPNISSRVDLTFDRFYNYTEMVDAMQRLQSEYPKLLTLESLGRSSEGRYMWMMTINNPATGSDRDKPAMFIDANVHGNEIQGAEVCLYTIWHLTKSYGNVPKLTKLVDDHAFYILPMTNPDGRAHWFDSPNTSSSSRSGKKPTDNDNDGLVDEDGYDDLNGDGYITYMWKKTPNGRYRRSNKDPRVFDRVARDETGDYDLLGTEGIDNDGDGRINEDGPGGYDMNRNWPSDWQPQYLQYGAGEYPFYYPETAAIGAFILDHPNIAAVQSYHNAGGMILRGPGAKYRESSYPRRDLAAYDEIGRTGEKILPYYRYIVIYKDLYPVHGGFVNWTAEGLGIFSFTNELWTNPKYFYGKEGDWDRSTQRLKFNDLLQFDQLFVPLEEFHHPTYGDILIGGFNKYASRVPPAFMLEELCHRNYAFTMYHAAQMPDVSVSRTDVRLIAAGTWRVTIELKNSSAIPSISAIAENKKIGARDSVTLSPSRGGTATVLASGTVSAWYDHSMNLTKHQPDRIWLPGGVGGHGTRICRFIVSGEGPIEITYRADKARSVLLAMQLIETSAQEAPSQTP